PLSRVWSTTPFVPARHTTDRGRIWAKNAANRGQRPLPHQARCLVGFDPTRGFLILFLRHSAHRPSHRYRCHHSSVEGNPPALLGSKSHPGPDTAGSPA